MNNLTIIGRIGKVSTLNYTQSGRAVINISVAVDNGKDAEGEKRAATWFEVALWEKQAEALAQYLVVGDRVGINGQVRIKVDKGQDGTEYHKLTVDFPRVELLGGSQNQKTEQTPPQQRANTQQRTTTNQPAANRRQAPAAAQVNDDDIPF